MAVTSKVNEVRKELDHLAGSVHSASELMEKIVRLLHGRMLKYN